MTDIMNMLVALITGFVLGAVFFGGLWLTLKKGITTKGYMLVFILSFFLRTAIVLVGFYLVASDNWKNLLVCVLGFTISRFSINHFVKLNTVKMKKGKEIANET